jgi:hypothetical protein
MNHTRGFDDLLEDFEAEAIDRCPAVVTEVMSLLSKYAIPIFRQVAGQADGDVRGATNANNI